MKLKANDTLHVSSVKADNILPGEEFEVSDDFGRQMVERGLAVEVSGGKTAKAEAAKQEPAKVEAKAEIAPLNKMTAPAANKSKKKGK
ncbi:hypothetical protein [Tardiphaga sp. 862_B3_N1_1]|uniref:hypothetical protein n=1 Tax=Tardiphaga sp. 862_B3_N1_1 TaxID=3240763 RepID=UPI003F8BA3FA